MSIVKRMKTFVVSDANPSLHHPIVYPDGYDEKALFDYLSAFRLDGDANSELDVYYREADLAMVNVDFSGLS